MCFSKTVAILSILLVGVVADRENRFICRNLTTAHEESECVIENEHEERPIVFGGLMYEYDNSHYNQYIGRADREVSCNYVSTLIFINCSLNFIPTKIFDSCYSFTKIDFSNSGLTSISNVALGGSTADKLQTLILSGNRIKLITNYTFTKSKIFEYFT